MSLPALSATTTMPLASVPGLAETSPTGPALGPVPGPAVSPASSPASLSEVARSLRLEGGGTRSIGELRSSMLASVDPRDPIGTMFALSDHALEAHAMFARLHISSGLASAATNLFGSLLKNQQ